MMPRNPVLAVLLALVVRVASADVTLRYSVNIKPGPQVPPELLAGMKDATRLEGMALYLKGGKASSRAMGFTVISDLDTSRVTMLDPTHRRFATVSSDEYVAAAANVGASRDVRKALESMKFDVKARVTGQTDVIRGIQAEEREVTISMQMPTGTPEVVEMRAAISFWSPVREAVAGNAALQELMKYSERSTAALNPADMISKMLPQMAGKLTSLTDEFKSTVTMLRMRGGVHMPRLAEMLAKLTQTDGSRAAGFDPKAPLMELSMEIEELSTAPLADSIFEVPKEYVGTTMAEILKPPPPPSRDPRIIK